MANTASEDRQDRHLADLDKRLEIAGDWPKAANTATCVTPPTANYTEVYITRERGAICHAAFAVVAVAVATGGVGKGSSVGVVGASSALLRFNR